MSATATTSEPAPARRVRWAPRWLVVAHRYLGVAVGGLMLLWCLSGVVMLFVHYPSVPEAERLARLAPIDWSRCCDFGRAISTDAPIRAAAIEDVAGVPVLRLKPAEGRRLTVDLSTGRPLTELPLASAASIAAGFGGAPAAVAITPVERDQWTVSGEFNRGRPFWRVRLSDPAKTDVYVSRRSGEVVQRTTAAGRLLNWFGAIPHWLYPQALRQDTALWTQVVIWTSLAGAFLTVVGLYLGLVAWRPFGDRRLSPYRGLMAWHHLTGLATGVLTLTWVASGLISMNPWGLLESPPDASTEQLAGPPPTFGQVQAALMSVAAQAPAVSQVRIAPLAGRLFVMAGDRRFDERGRPAPLAAQDLARAAGRLGPVADQGLIRKEDAYYFSHHDTVRLPAWRVITADGRRDYLDPRSGALMTGFDAQAKGFRWLHQGLHRLDFVPGFRQGAFWSLVTLVLLSAVTFAVGAGVWLACRRIGHDLSQLRRRRTS